MKKILTLVVVLVMLSASTTLAQDLCQSYHDRYRVCVEKRDAGREVDYSTCKNLCKDLDAGDCSTAGCEWVDFSGTWKCRASESACDAIGCTYNLNSESQKYPCMLDICLMDWDGVNGVGASDKGIFLREQGRGNCPTTPDFPTVCIPCEGTLSTGGRWCDQLDGTVKDMTTCLVWLQDADWGGTYAFWVNTQNGVNAKDRAAQLWEGSPYEGTAGLTDGSVEGDWRLPVLMEQWGITKGVEPISPGQPYWFTGVAEFYWTSTYITAIPTSAWRVQTTFGGGYGSTPKHYERYVWPVRSDN